MAFVVAIAGPSGAGKSTLAHAVARILGSAAVLEFDAYERASAQGTAALQTWLQAGADFDALAAPNLAEDLQAWRSGAIVRHLRGAALPRCEYLVFEMPLGRAYKPTAEMIDLLVWIDLPLELALARKLAQFTSSSERAPERIGWMAGFLHAYQQVVHDILLVQRERVRPQAELIIDGHDDIAVNATSIVGAVQEARTRTLSTPVFGGFSRGVE